MGLPVASKFCRHYVTLKHQSVTYTRFPTSYAIKTGYSRWVYELEYMRRVNNVYNQRRRSCSKTKNERIRNVCVSDIDVLMHICPARMGFYTSYDITESKEEQQQNV